MSPLSAYLDPLPELSSDTFAFSNEIDSKNNKPLDCTENINSTTKNNIEKFNQHNTGNFFFYIKILNFDKILIIHFQN